MELGEVSVLSFMLSSFSKPGLLAKATNINTEIALDRAPHCTWNISRHDAPADYYPSFGPSSSCIPNYHCSFYASSTYDGKEPFHDQVDVTAHLILAYDQHILHGMQQHLTIAASGAFAMYRPKSDTSRFVEGWS